MRSLARSYNGDEPNGIDVLIFNHGIALATTLNTGTGPRLEKSKFHLL